MEIGINIVDVVKYIFFTMVCSVLVAVWHYEPHQLTNEISKGYGIYNLEEKKIKMCWSVATIGSANTNGELISSLVLQIL